MPKVGDRVIIEGAKIGQQRREGSLIGITGKLLSVRWNDGSTSMLTPGAGSVRYLPKGAPGKGLEPRGAAAGKKAAAKPKKAAAGRKTSAKQAKKPVRKAAAARAKGSTKKK